MTLGGHQNRSTRFAEVTMLQLCIGADSVIGYWAGESENANSIWQSNSGLVKTQHKQQAHYMHI
jgi:hypothetical protein